MLIAGLVLLVLAVVAVAVALFQRRKWHLMAATETVTSARLKEEADAVAELGAAGDFRKVCEVVGAAQPGPDGPLTATISQVPCVWHRHVVRRRYWRSVSDGKGGRRQERRTEQVSEFSSGAAFTVADETGAVVVAPDGATVDRPERVHHEFKQDPSGGNLTALGVTIRLGDSDGTIGFDTEEWVIRVGTPLYVLGEASRQTDEVRVGKPHSGRFLISTRSEAELTSRARLFQRISMAVGAVAALAGAALLVSGALA